MARPRWKRYLDDCASRFDPPMVVCQVEWAWSIEVQGALVRSRIGERSYRRMTTHGHRGRFIHTRSFTIGMLREAEARGATMRLGNVTELGHSSAAVATR
jgi:hypothetical protein